jgi:hypothetical protein
MSRSLYNKAVKRLTLLYGSVFQTAGTEKINQVACVALATQLLFSKYSKLSDEEMIEAIMEVIPKWKNGMSEEDIVLFIGRMIIVRDLSANIKCCKGICGRSNPDVVTAPMPTRK